MSLLLLTENAIMVIMAIARSKGGGQTMELEGKLIIKDGKAYYKRVKHKPLISKHQYKKLNKLLEKRKDTKVIESESR